MYNTPRSEFHYDKHVSNVEECRVVCFRRIDPFGNIFGIVILIDEQVRYLTINFNHDALDDVLRKSDYDNEEETLFIWEGVSYYLSSDAVDNTLRFISKPSAIGSYICFDYCASWPEMMDAYGVKEGAEYMSKNASAESIRYAIEKGKINSFLSDRRFRMIGHLTPEEIESEYLVNFFVPFQLDVSGCSAKHLS